MKEVFCQHCMQQATGMSGIELLLHILSHREKRKATTTRRPRRAESRDSVRAGRTAHQTGAGSGRRLPSHIWGGQPPLRERTAPATGEVLSPVPRGAGCDGVCEPF